MPVEDIYTPENLEKEHSMRFIHIIARNVIGILNRIASLMRRKRYNMEEVSVAFDDQGFAHITIAVDGRIIDVSQAMEQILKLHDVMEVSDATDQRDKLYDALYVRGRSKNDFTDFPIKPVRMICEDDVCSGVFIISLDESLTFMKFLRERKFSYVRRVLSLI